MKKGTMEIRCGDEVRLEHVVETFWPIYYRYQLIKIGRCYQDEIDDLQVPL